MRRLFSLALVLTGALVLSAGVSGAGAGGKLAYTEVVEYATGNLIVTFDEGGQKRFDSVDYRLEATAVATYSNGLPPPDDQGSSTIYSPGDTATGVGPDSKGHVTGSLTLDDVPPSDGLCSCTRHMEYSNVTLTNLSSGHVYRLDAIAGDYP